MAAVIAPQHTGFWQRRGQAIHTPNMNMMGLYDPSRTIADSAITPAFQTTTAHMDINMSIFQSHPLTTSVPYQPGSFAFDSLSAAPYNLQQPFPVSYPSTLPQAVNFQGPAHDMEPVPTLREIRGGFLMERTSPPVKAEASSPVQPTRSYPHGPYSVDSKGENSEAGEGSRISFSTDVDTLMRAIQAKQQPTHKKRRPSPKDGEEERKHPGKPRKKYVCTMPNCGKDFYQKTHLEIHMRAHTGVKPFLCKEPTCGQRFSQLGNLKTHERRHTGERPYTCEECGKTFAQRGNVRAHKIVHQHVKPFTCLLDECGKHFTQLGNLKSHQNKFHANTIRFLTQKFASIQEDHQATEQEKSLWEYFASLYKNSNKGIKGRGKDRRISGPPSTVSSSSSYTSATATSFNRNYSGSIQHSASDRSSRSSSLSSDATQRVDDGYDFNATIPFSAQSNTYGDMVFPERKMF